MPRPQFSLKTLLWLMTCVACLFGGFSIGLLTQTERSQRREAAIGVDKRWQIPGAALTPDGTFVRIVMHPDGSNEQVEIAPVE